MANEIIRAQQKILQDSDPTIYTQPILDKPFEKEGARTNSVYVGDTFRGDSGKGIVIAEFNRLFVQRNGLVYSLRFNGGGNAGHHMWIDGVEYLVNQLPTAVGQEGATGLVTRGTVFNPQDALLEIQRTKATFGGEMPGKLKIDEWTPLSTNIHKALDTRSGSTGRGIGPAFSGFIGREEVTVRDLMSKSWRQNLGDHYDDHKGIIKAKLADVMHQNQWVKVSDVRVKRLDNILEKLGTKGQFLDRLGETREELRPYVITDMRELLRDVWADEGIPVTVEEAQGPALDPYSGVRPDVTSSRPSSRYVQDGTYNVIFGEDIACKVGVSKSVYTSGVGDFWLPGEMSPEESAFYQEQFGEVGKTTGRKRKIFHMPFPFMKDLRQFAGYDYLIATHLDAARKDVPIKVISHFTNSETGMLDEYFPQQDRINQLVPHYIEMAGWDGDAVNKAKTSNDLPIEARQYLALMSESIAPVLVARTGGNVGDNIWFATGLE